VQKAENTDNQLSISCTGFNPAGDGAIYRFVKGPQGPMISHYRSPEIASSWDANWASGAERKMDCTGFQVMPPVEMKEVQREKEQKEQARDRPPDSISCTGFKPAGDGAIYLFRSGPDGPMISHYRNPEIASSWDADWASGAERKIDCTGFQVIPPVEMKEVQREKDRTRLMEMDQQREQARLLNTYGSPRKPPQVQKAENTEMDVDEMLHRLKKFEQKTAADKTKLEVGLASAVGKAAVAAAAEEDAAVDKAILAAAAAAKVAADKVAADKVAADKVAADKVAADKVAADKVAADKVAADKVAADEAGKSNMFISVGVGICICSILISIIMYFMMNKK
jgi:chemotaxis protein histidine kinase CheA